MSQTGKNMIFLAAFFIVCAVSKAAVYNVGDSSGWTSIGDVDYKTWAATKHFQVGDTIVFKYKKEFHNVVRVSHKNYHLCNATGSYGTWTSGNDSFTIPKTGHYFFICSFPEHCQGGQRVDIRVPGKPSPKAAPSPSPISNHSPAGAPKASGIAPSPTPATAAPKASSPHGAPQASSPHVAPKASPPHVAPKASPPHVAPKASPPHVAPKASPPHVAPKASPVATPPAPEAPSTDAAPESSPDEQLPQAPAPSPTGSSTRSLPMKHLFFVAAISSIFCL